MKKKDPKKQLLDAAIAREESQRVLRRHFRGELAKVTRQPWTWTDPYSPRAARAQTHLADRDGQPFYVGDRVVLVDTNEYGMKGTIVPREEAPLSPEHGYDNGFNISVRWEHPPVRKTGVSWEETSWVGVQFLLHDLTFTSPDDIEEYLHG